MISAPAHAPAPDSARSRASAHASAHASARASAYACACALVIVVSLVVWPSAGGADEDTCPVDPQPVFAGHGFPLDAPLAPTPVEAVDAYPLLPSDAFVRPSDVLSARDGTGRLFVLEGPGRVRTFIDSPTTSQVTTWLDLTSQPPPLGSPTNGGPGDERGLLGLAFDPDFANPASPRYGEFYVDYVTTQGCNRFAQCTKIVRYRASSHDAASVDIATAELVMQIEQPYGNHNGGHIHFSPDPNDDNLYISSGDGGSGNDPGDRAQDLSVPLGKILRIAVRGETTYSIPPDNPYAGTTGSELEEIWHWGLRNPYRIGFDTEPPYDLWIGDVGQGTWEEVDVAPGGVSNVNFGWKNCEGAHPRGISDPSSRCLLPGATYPVLEYRTPAPGAVVGGRVYRGTALPELTGQYVYAEYAQGTLWAWDRISTDPGSGRGTPETLIASGPAISAISEDANGELLILRYGNEGWIERLQPASGGDSATFPALLSQTGLFDDVATLSPAEGVIEYEVNAPLWSDGALKRRFIALPAGETIEFSARGEWDFPVGTALVKHFELQTGASTTRIETRVFLRQQDDWLGFTYWWDGSGDAVLLTRALTLDVAWDDGGPMQQTWNIPSPGDCLGCHALASGRVLGVRTGQLNRPDPMGQDQLERWSCRDLFRYRIGPSSDFEVWPPADDLAADVQTRARAHLASNCAICHQPGTPTPGGMDMRFHTLLGDMSLVGTPALYGNLGLPAPALRIDPGGSPTPSEASVLWARMASSDPTVRMARGTLLPDDEHVTLVGDFIDGLPIDPNDLDSDLDGVGDGGPGADNCPAVANAGQEDGDGDQIGDACDPDAAPDLQARPVAPSNIVADGDPAVRVDVHNLGAGDAGPVQVSIYVSEDTALDPGVDPRVGGCRVGATSSGELSTCNDFSADVDSAIFGGWQGPSFDWYWIACADEPDAVFEGDEGNNCTTQPVRIAVPEPGALVSGLSGLMVLGLLAKRRHAVHGGAKHRQSASVSRSRWPW